MYRGDKPWVQFNFAVTFDLESLEKFAKTHPDKVRELVADELVASGMDLNRWVHWWLDTFEHIPRDEYGVMVSEEGWMILPPVHEFTHTDDPRKFTALVQAQMMDVFPKLAKELVEEFKRRITRHV